MKTRKLSYILVALLLVLSMLLAACTNTDDPAKGEGTDSEHITTVETDGNTEPDTDPVTTETDDSSDDPLEGKETMVVRPSTGERETDAVMDPEEETADRDTSDTEGETTEQGEIESGAESEFESELESEIVPETAAETTADTEPPVDTVYTRVNADGDRDAEGEYVLFGSFPQSEVTATDLTAALDALAGDRPTESKSGAWTSYGYYIANHNETAFMWYQDVTLEEETYRGVYFTEYRPFSTMLNTSEEVSYQFDNGYTTGNVYWFRFEPLKWRILTEEGGKALLLCEVLVDAQDLYHASADRQIDETVIHANNYAHSNIRAWLNGAFYHVAFNDEEKAIISLTVVDNSASSTNDPDNAYACENTEDYIFLPSFQDMINRSYGFDRSHTASDALRQKKTTAYARCQGLYSSTSESYAGMGSWWLRSPASMDNNYGRTVGTYGGVDINNYVDSTSDGVCPALWLIL